MAPAQAKLDILDERTVEALQRLETVQGAQEQADRAVSRATASLRADLERLSAELGSLRENVAFLHAKADENAVKGRPVIHRNGAYAVPLADGYLLIPEEEEALLLMYAGAGAAGLEPGTRRILQAVVRSGGHAIDVGASVGLHTLALARAVGSGGRVHAFEAEPRLHPFLKRTLGVNGLVQVRLHQLAAGAEDGEAPFHVATTIGHSSLYSLSGQASVREEVTVDVRRLDAVIDTEQEIDVIKIDVEGAELDVLRGARGILGRSPHCAIIAECGPSHLDRIGISLENWFAAFTQDGLRAYGIVEPSGRLRRASPGWAAEQHSANILFVRAGGRAEVDLVDRLQLLDD